MAKPLSRHTIFPIMITLVGFITLCCILLYTYIRQQQVQQ